MIAYCFRSGQIVFGKRGPVPQGALLIARGPAKELRAAVEVCARWSYPSRRGGKDPKPLVPGIPEAKDENAALAAFEKFIAEVKKRLPTTKP